MFADMDIATHDENTKRPRYAHAPGGWGVSKTLICSDLHQVCLLLILLGKLSMTMHAHTPRQ